MPKQYWLMKSEPDVYGYDDLERDGWLLGVATGKAPGGPEMGARGSGFFRGPCHAGIAGIEFYGGISQPDAHIRDGCALGPGQEQVNEAFLYGQHEFLPFCVQAVSLPLIVIPEIVWGLDLKKINVSLGRIVGNRIF